MKKLFFIVLLFLGWQCSPPQPHKRLKSFYIYDNNLLLSDYKNSNDSLDYLGYETRKTVRRYYIDSIDTILIAQNYKYYRLFHYLKYNDYKDTSFIKHKSYINNIDYFDNKWLDNEEKLDSFWKPASCWRCGGIYDTTEIYLILPIENTDSLIFRQVHRWFHQTQ